jgi:hypothetical protein
MHRIIEAVPLSGSTVRLRFDDGNDATLDFSSVAGRGGVFSPLRDSAFFRQVRIGADGRSLEWPEDIDFCADALWMAANASSENNVEQGREPARVG